ncbi:hypothetical protein FLL60_11925 [Vibrio cholerae]|nr:hypothetical protein FLL60_11925 [Vibrio cholerae]
MYLQLGILSSPKGTKSNFPNSEPNARLRGWQRIKTKLKHNNRNHRGSMGLETPRVDSPS